MKLEEIRAAEDRLLLTTYERSPVLFTGGEGVHIIDEKGDRYLDLLSGIGVNALGYNHPAIVETIARQSRSLIHISNLYYHEGQAELALAAHRAYWPRPCLLLRIPAPKHGRVR